MEATHLGASFSKRTTKDLGGAIELLSKQAVLPGDTARLVAKNGSIDAKVARRLHEWLAPAIAIAGGLGNDAGTSLGVPTWLYGFEPTSPLRHILRNTSKIVFVRMGWSL